MTLEQSIQSFFKAKKLLNDHEGERIFLKNAIAECHNKLDVLDQDLYCCAEVREVFQKSAQITQTYLETNLSNIVTRALGIVFEDIDLGFTVRFVPKRNGTECEMWLTEDGEEYDPLNSSGFGAADVISFALRLAMWKINKTRNTLVFDEPFRNLDEWRMPQASLMLAVLGQELGVQMIVVTHEDALSENADKVFTVSKKNGVSTVKVKQ